MNSYEDVIGDDEFDMPAPASASTSIVGFRAGLSSLSTGLTASDELRRANAGRRAAERHHASDISIIPKSSPIDCSSLRARYAGP